MQFELNNAVEVLSATPTTLKALIGPLSSSWTESSGAEGEWQAFDVVGHLIHGDETDWIPRAEIILAQDENRTFTPFDRFAQFGNSKGKTLGELLDEFEQKRKESLGALRSWNLSEEQLDLKGMHPELGEVTLRQLLATWVIHDLNHVRQIATAMAKKYENEVGPWKQYLSILN